MKAKELLEKTDEELREIERQLAGDKFRIRIQRGSDQLKDSSAMAKARRDLARVKTTLRARELDRATESQKAGGDDA